MKKEEIVIYSIKELSPESRERAYEDYIGGYFEYDGVVDEGMDSVRAFCDLFSVAVKNWQLSSCGQSFILTDHNNDSFRDIKPAADIPEGDGRYPLTGSYLDDVLLASFHFYTQKHGDTKGAFEHAIEAAEKYITAAMEEQESRQCFEDMAEANGWDFTENGQLWGAM